MRKQGFYLLIFMTLTLVACQKDELTLPASVVVNFNFTPFEKDDIDLQSNKVWLKNRSLNTKDVFQQNVPPGLIKKMEIFEATFFITDIIIEGIREQGDDVYETIPFDPPLEIKLDEHQTTSQDLSFDIPQGIYKNIELHLFLGTEKKPALEFIGEVTPGNSPTGGLGRIRKSNLHLKSEMPVPSGLYLKRFHRSVLFPFFLRER